MALSGKTILQLLPNRLRSPAPAGNLDPQAWARESPPRAILTNRQPSRRPPWLLGPDSGAGGGGPSRPLPWTLLTSGPLSPASWWSLREKEVGKGEGLPSRMGYGKPFWPTSKTWSYFSNSSFPLVLISSPTCFLPCIMSVYFYKPPQTLWKKAGINKFVGKYSSLFPSRITHILEIQITLPTDPHLHFFLDCKCPESTSFPFFPLSWYLLSRMVNDQGKDE